MAPERIIYTYGYVPKEEVLLLSPECQNNICNQMNTFLLEQGVYNTLLENQDILSVMATYPNKTFCGGPGFLINKDPNNNLWTAEVWKTNGNGDGNKTNFLIAPFAPQNKCTTIIEHSFRKNDREARVEDWFNNVVNSIRIAQDRDCFNWLYKTEHIEPL